MALLVASTFRGDLLQSRKDVTRQKRELEYKELQLREKQQAMNCKKELGYNQYGGSRGNNKKTRNVFIIQQCKETSVFVIPQRTLLWYTSPPVIKA